MSCANVKIRLANAIRPDISPVEVEAVADSEQPYLLLPVKLTARLGLKPVCKRTFPWENGHRETCPYVGPIHLQLGSETCFVGAVVRGSRVRVGFIALASMNLVVDPATGKVVTNPAGPTRIGTVTVQESF